MQALATFYGSKIGIYSGSVPKLLEDLQVLQPSFVAFVPRLLTKFQAQIKAQLKQKNRLVQKLFDYAVKTKTKSLLNGKVDYNTVWDRTVFKPIHRLVGGRLRFIVTGGAKTASDVKYFSSVVYGCPVFEGYGQTECAAAVTLTITSDISVGHIGVPAPWAQIKLISVPELGYLSENNEGEICLRGTGVMNGYFEQQELTEQVLDSEGWLKTGDIGRWQPNGNLELIDRKTNFFKLEQGDFVSPERAEAAYQICPLISQIFIYGRQTESYLVAIIVPVIDRLKEIIGQSEKTKHLLEIDNVSDLLQNAELKTLALEYLREHGKSNGLNELEQIKNLYFEIEEFTPDNNLLTPTLKMKRNLIAQKYAEKIDEMYAKS
ncbi:AMP-binding enzyme [Aphelenchoides bicaudatus]|nr:AMP-binding enzyme [Aphelenchoides bicaudatus]